MIAEAIFAQTSRAVVDFILPPRCPLCRQRVDQQGSLCGPCWSKLVPLSDPACAICDFPFEVDFGSFSQQVGEQSKTLCASCQRQPPALDRILTALAYDDASKEMILKFKHGRKHALARPLARLMLSRLYASHILHQSQFINQPLSVVPIPLHLKRLRKRRFNQSLLLAQKIVSELNRRRGEDVARVLPSLLSRHSDTPSQAGLSKKGRFRNLQRAFRANISASKEVPKSVLIIDDVFTTGATLEAAAKALKRAGVQFVFGLCAARAPGPR